MSRGARLMCRACPATLCSQSTSYFVATVWVTEVKSRWPRLSGDGACMVAVYSPIEASKVRGDRLCTWRICPCS